MVGLLANYQAVEVAGQAVRGAEFEQVDGLVGLHAPESRMYPLDFV